MKEIERQLAFLYGAEIGSLTAERLHQVLEERSRELTRGRAAAPFHESDALLITYADQVREPRVPPLRSLGIFAKRFLKGRISGIHLLPFYPWSSDDGFSVKDYYQVDPDYGSWADIHELSRDFELMFDAVLNHMSAQSQWFRAFLAGDSKFNDFFVSVTGSPDLSQVIRPRALPLLTEFDMAGGRRKIWTTFSADQVDLNLANPAVLLALVDVLLFYVAQGARYIRLDAIAFLWKEIGTTCLHLPRTHATVQLFRSVLDRLAPYVRLITETNVPHADNISYFGDGTNEAQLVYNFALPPLLVHSFRIANAEALTSWAQALRAPSDSTTFFNFTASHDGIGVNPVRGILPETAVTALAQHTLDLGGLISYKHLPNGSQIPYELNINFLDALGRPGAVEAPEMLVRKFITSQAIMLSLPGIPGIYFHSLFGSRGDREGALESGIPRRINREKLQLSQLVSDLANPASFRSAVYREYTALLQHRREHPAFSPASPAQVLSLDSRVFAIRRGDPAGGNSVLCLHNLSGEDLEVQGHVLDAWGFRWIEETS